MRARLRPHGTLPAVMSDPSRDAGASRNSRWSSRRNDRGGVDGRKYRLPMMPMSGDYRVCRDRGGIFGMEMHQVHYFLAVFETLNFTRAAGDWNGVQPPITPALLQLQRGARWA